MVEDTQTDNRLRPNLPTSGTALHKRSHTIPLPAGLSSAHINSLYIYEFARCNFAVPKMQGVAEEDTESARVSCFFVSNIAVFTMKPFQSFSLSLSFSRSPSLCWLGDSCSSVSLMRTARCHCGVSLQCNKRE